MADAAFAVEMRNITKTFGDGFKANDDVTITVPKGEIHALVGENGAGKSTLLKILYGMHTPDTGRITVNGHNVSINSPRDAIKHGIGMVHQHFMLAGELTVLENIILGNEISRFSGITDYKTCREKISALAKNFNISINIDSKVDGLPVGVQQKIEILKILYRNADILILDEPTAVLTPLESEELFSTLKKLASEGKTVILITHKLGEVFSAAASVTVLRRGKVRGEFRINETSGRQLAALIVGEDFEPVLPLRKETGKDVILSVQNLSVKNDRNITALKNISFEIHIGEILGIAGVEGNGQSELVEAIFGIRKFSGLIRLKNKTVNKTTIISYIPADRHRHGIVKEFTVAENLILGRQDEDNFSSPLILKEKNIANYAGKLISEYDIRPETPEIQIGSLSGGNQQKAVAARELTKSSDLIIASHPTRGLDIKASNFVHTSLLNESRKGKAILLISSELSELLSLSTRIAVMFNGEILKILDADKTTEQEIGLYMTGALTETD